MKKLLMSLICCLSVTVGFSQTQAQMNSDANATFQKADKELNVVYQKILKEYKDDPVFIKSMITAQKLWVQLRDADVKMMYPDREAGYYGSMLPLCVSEYKAKLTKERTAKLKRWLTGVEEGDVCSGSVKIN
jgi:uncharacterized protein YecT (DUF1311 family)